MTPIATYGLLLEQATGHLRDGNRQIHHRRFDDRDQARDAVDAYYGLLDATRQHLWALIGPARMAGLAASEHPNAAEAAALNLLDSLPAEPDDLPPHPAVLTPPRHPWDHAGQHLRAATDLVGTHVSPTGAPRTPDALTVWDPAARTSGLARTGQLLTELLDAQDGLALRVGQTGLHWARVARWLPDTTRTRDLAHTLATTAPAEDNGLDALAAATTRIRRSTPVDELTERVSRIRRTAWNLHDQPDYSIRTLADITRAGFDVAVHTAAFHAVDLHDPTVVARDPTARAVAAWLALHHDLAGYRTPSPADHTLRTDVAAIHELLDNLVPRDRPSNADRATSADPAERHLAGTLHHASAALTQASRWGSDAFGRLARSGQVYLPVTGLTRDELSADADLAATKLTRPAAHVPASPERTDVTLALYQHVDRTKIDSASPRPVDQARAAAAHDRGPVLTRTSLA
jgi:hypothetical protein